MRRWIWIVLAIAALACRRSPDHDLPAAYRDLAVPQKIIGSGAARANGAITFSRYCALCHGAAGDGRGVRVSSLSTKPRDFTDHAWQQRTSDRHIFFAIREGVNGTAMPSWRSLSEEQTWELVAFIRSLSTSVVSLTRNPQSERPRT